MRFPALTFPCAVRRVGRCCGVDPYSRDNTWIQRLRLTQTVDPLILCAGTIFFKVYRFSDAAGQHIHCSILSPPVRPRIVSWRPLSTSKML